MQRGRRIRIHATGECSHDFTLQINWRTHEQVCAPPESIPRFLGDVRTWVMAPVNWLLQPHPITGRLRFVPPI
jgi:hypothetical protein